MDIGGSEIGEMLMEHLSEFIFALEDLYDDIKSKYEKLKEKKQMQSL